MVLEESAPIPEVLLLNRICFVRGIAYNELDNREKLMQSRFKNQDFRVAIIDNSIHPSVYNPVKHWSRYLDCPWDSFEAKKGEFPSLKDGYTHLILTGSEASILEREDWVRAEEEVVREAVDAGLSILGSCYGHQLLALALEGTSAVGRCGEPEIGWIPIRILEKNNILGSQSPAYSFSSHFDEVRELGSAFLVLAASAGCAIQAFQVKGKPVWGIQMHPEIDIPTGQRFLKDLIEMGFKGSLLMEKALVTPPRDSGLIKAIIARFFLTK